MQLNVLFKYAADLLKKLNAFTFNLWRNLSRNRYSLMFVLLLCVCVFFLSVQNKIKTKMFTLAFSKDEIFVEEAFVVRPNQHFQSPTIT